MTAYQYRIGQSSLEWVYFRKALFRSIAGVLSVLIVVQSLAGAGAIYDIVKGKANIAVATSPSAGVMYKADGNLTGFGREVQYLQARSYVYNPATSTMVKK